MTAPHIVDPARLLGEALADSSPDLMRQLLQTMINTLLSADADAVVGAEWGQASPDRVAQRNGYRHRDLDTRVGTIDVQIPKLRQGTYFPEWLLERRKRAETALITVVADCYLAGVGGKKDRAGWEVETVVTVPNAPGQPDSFPILTTALTMHQPGRTKHGPRIALEHHAREFGEEERGLLLADRLYNGSKPERFQKHVMAMRFRTVYDYKVRNSGLHGAIDDVIFVGGRPYVKWMPQALITARDDFKSGRIDQQTYQSRLAARTGYKLKDHGRPENEGRQRFTYPDLSKVLCIDPATQKAVKPVLKKKTLTLAPENAESMRVIKHLQHFEHKSPVWREWYGMRSHVESNNQYVKSDAETDLGNPEKRRPRGYAYQALCAAMAFALSNMRRIVSFLESAYKRATDDSRKQRERRRTDEHGTPLPH